ncbi:MAG: hypothetical protein Q9166_001275 [cf. Caloplaca sp. 2 TL-2023]
MKERITFIHAIDGAFHSSHFDVGKGSVQIKDLDAVREEQLTFPSRELPPEIWQVLRQCHELHLKWVSAVPYPSIPPFLSRASPGLHLFFSPKPNRSADILRPTLQKIFGSSNLRAFNESAFIQIHNKSFPRFSPLSYQYHEALKPLRDFLIYLQNKVCPKQDYHCSRAAARLEQALYFDIDYKHESQNLILTYFHDESPESGSWNALIKPRPNSVKTEIGVLAKEDATEPEELSLGGFLSIVGEDDKPKSSRFSFPSRHHAVPTASGSTFVTTFPPPTGLHPTLRLSFPSPTSPPAQACGLHTYLTLPSSLFVDKYQLSSPNFLASKNLRAIRSLLGETDLEAPDWVIRKWGSILLLELAPPAPSQAKPKAKDARWDADIPLHLRYLRPAAGGITKIDVPWPVVFWACKAEEGTELDGNPFDRINLGYEGLFDPQTIFYHLEPRPMGEGVNLVIQVQVPVIDLEGTRWVESGTIGIVVLGAMWVIWKFLRASLSNWRSKETSVEKKVQ